MVVVSASLIVCGPIDVLEQLTIFVMICCYLMMCPSTNIPYYHTIYRVWFEKKATHIFLIDLPIPKQYNLI